MIDQDVEGRPGKPSDAPPQRHSRLHADPLEKLRHLGHKADPAGSPARRGAHRASKNTHRRWPRRTLIVVNIAAVLALIIAGSSYGYVEWRLGQLKRIKVDGLLKVGHTDQSKPLPGSNVAPFTLLVIGSDSRNLGSGSSSQFGARGQVGGQRSDSIILVRVAPSTRSIALLSIPRDTLVAVPGYGTTRINSAFNSGTPSLLVQVLGQDFGIEVNHVLEFNFDTFQQIAGAVGGVEQYFPAPAKDNNSLLSIPRAGCYNLSGAAALAFARSREYQYYLNGRWNYQYYPESDLARIQRQQAFTRDLVKKARKVAPTNLFELNSIIASITKNLTLDSTFSNSLIFKLAQDFRSSNVSTIPSYTFPTVNSTAQPGALDPQFQPGKQVIQQWLSVGVPAPPKPPSSAQSAPSATTTTLVAPSTVNIEVLNGSGVGGQAGRAGEDLTAAGYKVAVSGDAPNFGLATTEIEYAPDALPAAQQLSHQIIGGATLLEDQSLTPTPFNLAVVTGTSYAGISAGSEKSSSSAATTTTTIESAPYAGTSTVNPASSSIYEGVYVPPGLVPGQTPQTCGE